MFVPQEAALCEQLKTIPSPKGQKLLCHVLEHRARVKELAMSRGQALHTSLMMANFTRAAAQVRGPSLPIAQPLEYIVQLEVTVTHTHTRTLTTETVLESYMASWRPWSPEHLV